MKRIYSAALLLAALLLAIPVRGEVQEGESPHPKAQKQKGRSSARLRQESQAKGEEPFSPEKRNLPGYLAALPAPARPFALALASPFARRAPERLDLQELELQNAPGWDIPQGLKPGPSVTVTVDGMAYGSPQESGQDLVQYLDSIPLAQMKTREASVPSGGGTMKSTYDAKSQQESLDWTSDYSHGEEGFRGSMRASSDGLYNLGLEAGAKELLGGSAKIKYQRNDYGLWGESSFSGYSGTVKDSYNFSYSRGPWGLSSEFTSGESTSKSTQSYKTALSFDDGVWVGSAYRKGNSWDYYSGSGDGADQYWGLSWARRFQYRQVSAQWGLELEEMELQSDLDNSLGDRRRLSPFVNFQAPLGDFSLAWKLKYNQWNWEDSSYSDGLEQTITLTLKKTL